MVPIEILVTGEKIGGGALWEAGCSLSFWSGALHSRYSIAFGGNIPMSKSTQHYVWREYMVTAMFVPLVRRNGSSVIAF